MQVTFEAVKEQLEILGHQVPDDVVRDFLADLKQEQATQPATSASGGSPSAQQAGAASSQLSADHGHSLAANAQTQCNTSRARFTMDVPELSGNYASTDANQAGTYAMPCMPTGSDSLFQGARPLHTAHPSAHVCNTNGTAGQLPPAVAVPTSVRNVDSIGPDQFDKCHRLAPDSPAATSLKSYSNGLLDDATARREQRRPLSAANLQPIGHGGPCATRHYQDGHHLNPSAHKPDDSDAVRSITERAEALLAAHDAQRVAILQDDFAGLDLAPGQRSKHIHSHKHTAKPRHVDNRAHGRKDAQRTAATSQQRAKPLSAEWNHFQQQNQDYGDDAVPAHMAPTSSARPRSARNATPKVAGRAQAPRPMSAAPHSHKRQLRPAPRQQSTGSDNDSENDYEGDHELEECSIYEPPLLRQSQATDMRAVTSKAQLSGTARKVDRVARYQQLQAQWSRDRFLQSTSKPRKNVGFQRAFAAAHEASRADLEELKAENAWESARALASGYVPPEGKRRDTLRWQTRVAMQQQEL